MGELLVVDFDRVRSSSRRYLGRESPLLAGLGCASDLGCNGAAAPPLARQQRFELGGTILVSRAPIHLLQRQLETEPDRYILL